MKKILLLLVLTLMVGGVNAKTDKLYASFGTPTGATYSDNKFTWTENSGQYMDMLTFAAGDLSKYAKLRLKATKTGASEIHYRIQFRASSGSDPKNVTKRYETSDTELVIDLSTIDNIADMTKIILFCDNSEKGSITIKQSEVYLETDEYENMEVTTPIQELYWYDYSSGADYDRTAGGLQKRLNTTVAGDNQIIFGPYSGNATTAYMDVTGYDNAVFTLNTAGTPGIRLMYNSSTITIDTDNTKTSYTQSVSTMQKIATIKTKNGSGGVSFDIASINFAKNFKATSGTPFNISASSSSIVNYDRTFTKGEKYTICLPFALTTAEVSAAGEFYKLSGVSEDVLDFITVTETEAYKPYIFVPKTTGTPFEFLTNKAILATPTDPSGYATTADSYTFQGVLAATEDVKGANSGCYVYGFRAGDGTFVKVTGNSISVKAFRAYIKVADPMALSKGAYSVMKASFGGGNGTTAIKKVETVSDDDPNAPVYNLAGQQVDASYKGIVIKNGKKYFQNK